MKQDIKLNKIDIVDTNNILELTKNPDVMKYIGNSKIWDKEKVSRFIKYCLDDESQADYKRQQYYYKINNSDNEFIGIIGFHKFPRKELPDTVNDFYLTVYLDPRQQGKGYFTQAINLLLKKMSQYQPRKQKLYSLVRQSNENMIQISNKKFEFIKSVTLGNENMNLYLIKQTNIHTNRKTNKKSNKNLSQKQHTKRKSNKIHYYFTAAKNVSDKRIDELFRKRGNWKRYDLKKDKNKKIDYIYIDHQDNIYNKKVQSYPSFIKNFIDDDKHKVGRKNELYQNLGNLVKKNPELSLKKYLLEQHNFDWSQSHKEGKTSEEINRVKSLFDNNPGKIWIYKPVAGFKGMNIRIFKSFEEFDNYIHEFINTYSPIWYDPKNKSRMAAQSQWVMQEYITHPLLFNNKKFHIRPIFLYHKKGDQKIGYILDRILVAHAYEDFKLEDFDQPRIHDTHFASTTTGRIYLQEDFPKYKILTKEQIQDIEKQVRDLGTYVFNLMNSRCYPENKVCYETFGMDLIIDGSTLTIKLMEVQITNISYGFFDDDKIPGFSNMFEYVLENSLETVVDQYIPPKNKFEKANGFIKFYQNKII
jgi:RimJ/RimL family protein N-acetyltransferase